MDLIYVLVAVFIFIGLLGLAGTRYANWSAGKIADRAIQRIKDGAAPAKARGKVNRSSPT